MTDSKRTRWVLIAIRIIFAAVFISSGLLKVLDARLFGVTLFTQYGLPLPLAVIGVVFPILEFSLGVYLALYRPSKLFYTVTMALLATFTAFIGFGTLGGNLQDCGCFGPLGNSGPGLAILRNVFLFGLAFYARKHVSSQLPTVSLWRQSVLALGLVLSSGLTTISLQTPFFDIAPHRNSPFPTLGEATTQQGGKMLIYIFDPECPHCWNNAPRVESYLKDPSFRVLGFTSNQYSEAEIQTFREKVDVTFAIHQIAEEELAKLARRGFPVSFLLVDGIIKARYEGDQLPTLPTLQLQMPQLLDGKEPQN